MGFQRTHYWTLKSKMAEIRHFENRHDVIFSAEGGTIWIKFCRLVQNDMSTAMIWSKSKPDVEFQYGGRTFGRIPWHVIPEPPATLQSAATWRIQCHDPKLCVTLQGAATGRIQRHVIPEPRITLQGAATW